MQISDTALSGIRLIQMPVHHDTRGYFLETWQSLRYQKVLGITAPFVQHNQSFSVQHVLRGMHYQRRRGQGKLIRVVHGRIWDVAIDLRSASPTFGQWLGFELAGIDAASPQGTQRQIWIPPGFAHGFLVLSSQAIVEYLCTDFYDPDDEVCLHWSDPDVNVTWPCEQPVLSPRDAQGFELHHLQEKGLLPAGRALDSSVPGPDAMGFSADEYAVPPTARGS